MASERPGQLVFFFGPAGAGKTTLAKAWCTTRERAVQVQLDEIRSMIVSGLADPQGDSPLVSEQYAVAARSCCALAREFLASGYDMTIDDAETPGGFEMHWKPFLDGLNSKVVVIGPDLETTLSRNRERQKTVRDDIIQQQHSDAEGWPSEWTVNTAGLTVSESLAGVTAVIEGHA